MSYDERDAEIDRLRWAIKEHADSVLFSDRKPDEFDEKLWRVLQRPCEPGQHALGPSIFTGLIVCHRCDYTEGKIEEPEDLDDEDVCAFCRASLDDGEGWDGYCGNCADRIAQGLPLDS